jgi:hypothetical protein
MSVITWHRLRIRRISQPGHRSMVFAYTILMFLLTFVDYVSSALVLEAALIEGPAGTSAAAGAQLCSAVGITNNVVSSLQFLLSDALMVRPNVPCCAHALTCYRSTEHSYCSADLELWLSSPSCSG